MNNRKKQFAESQIEIVKFAFTDVLKTSIILPEEPLDDPDSNE